MRPYHRSSIHAKTDIAALPQVESLAKSLVLHSPTMRARPFLLALGLTLSVSSVASAETIESSNHSTSGYIHTDGTIEDASHRTRGYIRSDGTIESSSHSTIGYLRGGTVENASHSTVGYIRSDGTVESSSHSTIGYVRADGTVENASHSTLGYARGVRADWAAVVFFFFRP